MRVALALGSCALCGCASGEADYKARLHKLELEVAELRGRVAQMGRVDPAPAATDVIGPVDATRGGCAKTIDVSIPAGTQMTTAVAFDVGHTNTRAGDRITITDVHGTRGDFAVGGTYLVRGEYTLASADEATLGFSVTAMVPGEGCTYGNTRQTVHVSRGSGTFELANGIPYRGYPHVTFYVQGQGSGGVYFGKGDFLQR
jgi:hypothetical protein